MSNRVIITSGAKYLDIDAYGAIFAYRELLKSQGIEAYAMSTVKPNESVSPLIIDLGFTLDEVKIEEDDAFTILDVSNPDFFDTFVNPENIIEIVDHHTGYESYWQEKGITSHIEFIGSVCTIIYEKYAEYERENLLTKELCQVLATGILDNTLNLKSAITTGRDKHAYERLLELGNLGHDWNDTYFSSCYGDIEKNLKAIEESIKIERVSDILPEAFGQLIVLDIDSISQNMNRVEDIFSSYEEWILNIICLNDSKSYLYCSPNSREKLQRLFPDATVNDYLILDRCILRKEIMKMARNKSKAD